jgi:hypothetical protein
VGGLHYIVKPDLEVVIQSLNDPDPEVRTIVIQSVAALHQRMGYTDEDIERLTARTFLRGLEDTHTRTQEEALNAVTRRGIGWSAEAQSILLRHAEARHGPISKPSWRLLAAHASQFHAEIIQDPNARRIVMGGIWDADDDIRTAARKIRDDAWAFEPYPDPPVWKVFRILSWVLGGVCAAVAGLASWGLRRGEAGFAPSPSLDLAGRVARGTGVFLIVYACILLGLAFWFRPRGTLTPPEVFGGLIVLTIAIMGVGYIGWAHASRFGQRLDKAMLFAWSLALLLVMGLGLVANGMVLLAMNSVQDVQYETVGTVIVAAIGLLGSAFVAAQLLRGWANEPATPALAVESHSVATAQAID